MARILGSFDYLVFLVVSTIIQSTSSADRQRVNTTGVINMGNEVYQALTV